MKRFAQILMRLAVLLMVISMVSSCFGSRPVSYFSQGAIDTALRQQIVVALKDQSIQKGDILSITVFSDNPQATSIFNQAGNIPSVTQQQDVLSKSIQVGQVPGASNAAGYLVNNEGNIRMHAIGEIKAEGLTKEQLADTIVSRINRGNYLSNAYAIVRLSNFKITVLGEVRQPGVITLLAEKANVLEAIGMAGDLTDYSLKDRVLLVRENQGVRSFHRINLLDPNVFSSPYFMLRQNDVIVVESDKRKPTAMDQMTIQMITLAATLVTSLAIVITVFK